jgi:NADH-quinone oxidoreductase subunit J
MREYLLPFQLAAIVLLVALIGAVVIAMEERRRRIPTLADDIAAQRGAADRAEDGTP